MGASPLVMLETLAKVSHGEDLATKSMCPRAWKKCRSTEVRGREPEKVRHMKPAAAGLVWNGLNCCLDPLRSLLCLLLLLLLLLLAFYSCSRMRRSRVRFIRAG